ncbi:MAG: hypothetical protein IJC02_11475 [Lachnospiraceae bacterium]|nr:hypothetical protein [Lachnospiraceae bacterium]MBQ6994945.1 hypothetical protein [Lachnospiraceae bacterium]
MWGVFIFAYQYSVIGGDRRQEILLKELREKASCIRFGVGTQGDKAVSLELAVSLAENLLLPIPMCKGNRINIQQQDIVVTKEDVLKYLKKGQCVFAGCMDKVWSERAKEKGVACYDYMEEKSIAIYNSIATAEGTIAEILLSYPRNLHGIKVMVLGYGICAKTLAAKLRGLSAKVCIAARSEHALMEAYANGYCKIRLEKISEVIGEYPLIINTIPARVVTRKELESVDKEVEIYEIASFPYGVDIDTANELGITVRICPSLPAKYAPISSAEILKQYILEKTGGNV